MIPVNFYGETVCDAEGYNYTWFNTKTVYACAYDIPVPGYGPNAVCNTMRFWSAKSTNEFDLNYCKRNLKFHVLSSCYKKGYKNIYQNSLWVIRLHLFLRVYSLQLPEVYSERCQSTAHPEPCQTFEMELFNTVNIYLFKFNKRNFRKRCEICSKLAIKPPERRH